MLSTPSAPWRRLQVWLLSTPAWFRSRVVEVTPSVLPEAVPGGGGASTTSMARATLAATIAAVAAYGAIVLQQVLYARALGVSGDTDALAAALAWAVATSGLIGTTLQSAALPRYAQHLMRDHREAQVLLGTASAIALGVGLLVALGTFVGADLLAVVLLPGSSSVIQHHLATLLRLTAPLHLTWVAVWLTTTVANARERFVLAALAPVAASAPVIALFLLVAAPDVAVVAMAYVVGTILQVVLIVAAVPDGARDAMPRLAASALRALRVPLLGLGATFLLLNLAGLLVRALGSTLETGDVAAVDYAARSAYATEQVLAAGLLAVALTRWSKDAVTGEIGRSVGQALPVLVDVSLLLAAAFASLGTVGVGLLFGARAFDQHAVATVGALLGWMAPGVAAHLVLLLLVRALLATLRVGTMVVMGAVALVTLGIVGWVLLPIGLAAVGIGYSVSWLAADGVALVALRGSLDLGAVARQALRGLVVAGCAGAAALVTQIAIPGDDLVHALVGAAALVVMAVLAGRLLRTALSSAVFRFTPWKHAPA